MSILRMCPEGWRTGIEQYGNLNQELFHLTTKNQEGHDLNLK